MSATLPVGRTLLTGNEAAALAVVLARVQAIGCYPITPQTLIVERLAELVAERDDVEFANLESEHSMFGYAIAATRAGVRSFTATSSQGLLYAHEQLHRAARERVPLVAVDVNRAILSPWSLEPDLADSMSQRDTGWIQLYCSTAQEVLDSVLCAYRVAEAALLPVLVCAEGFLLSHTSEVVDVPSQEAVDAFLPARSPPAGWQLETTPPRAYAGLPEPGEYAAFQRRLADALDDARPLLGEAAAALSARVGRRVVAALELAGPRDAGTALVVIGTIGETARELVDARDDLLLVRVHAYRPFPTAELAAVLAPASRIVVVDRVAAFGALAPLGADVRALGLDAAEVVDVVCGVGGTEVTAETLEAALRQTGGREAVWL